MRGGDGIRRVVGDRVEDVPRKEIDRNPQAVMIGGVLTDPTAPTREAGIMAPAPASVPAVSSPDEPPSGSGSLVAATNSSQIATLSGSTGGWQTLDVSAFVPVGATAILVHAHLQNAPGGGNDYALYRLAAVGEEGTASKVFRIYTDLETAALTNYTQGFALVKLNANREIKHSLGDTGGVTGAALKLAGYIT